MLPKASRRGALTPGRKLELSQTSLGQMPRHTRPRVPFLPFNLPTEYSVTGPRTCSCNPPQVLQSLHIATDYGRALFPPQNCMTLGRTLSAMSTLNLVSVQHVPIQPTDRPPPRPIIRPIHQQHGASLAGTIDLSTFGPNTIPTLLMAPAFSYLCPRLGRSPHIALQPSLD